MTEQITLPPLPGRDIVERAYLWLAEADRLGINMTDENGYLAVIRDLLSEVEFQRIALQGYRNEQERLTDECQRAWREVDKIARERDDHHRWRQELADDLGKVEKTRDVLARTVNDQERELGLLRAVRDAAADLCDDAEEYECDGLGLFAQHGSWEPLHDALDAVRPCTCHPDDNPPKPCPHKYALSECRAAVLADRTARDKDAERYRFLRDHGDDRIDGVQVQITKYGYLDADDPVRKCGLLYGAADDIVDRQIAAMKEQP